MTILIFEAIPDHFFIEHGPQGGFSGVEMGPLETPTLLFSWPSDNE